MIHQLSMSKFELNAKSVQPSSCFTFCRISYFNTLSASLWELHMLKCHNSFAKIASLQDKSLVITSMMKGAKNFTGEKSLYISSYRCHLIHLCTHNLPLLKFPTFAHIQFGGCEDLLSTKYHLEKQTAFYKPTLTFSAHNMFLQGIHKLQKLLHT